MAPDTGDQSIERVAPDGVSEAPTKLTSPTRAGRVAPHAAVLLSAVASASATASAPTEILRVRGVTFAL